MRFKGILFSLFVVAGAFLLKSIPLQKLFTGEKMAPYANEITNIIFGCSAAIIGWVIAKHFNILKEGGFANYKRKNYWMVLLPFFFPGLLFTGNLNFTCFTSSIGIIFFVGSVFSLALLEELVFRGLIMGYLRKYSPGASGHVICIFSAFLFSMVHISNAITYELLGVLQQVVYAFIMGLLFSALLLRINNVWLLGLGHAVLNIITSSQCNQKFVDGNSKYSLADYISNIGIAILIISPVLLIYWYLMRNYKHTNSVLDDIK